MKELNTVPKSHSHNILRVILAMILFLTLALPGQAQVAQEITITPNYKEADIRQIIEAVGEVTGRNFIIDPRVNGNVTMLSSTPMSPDAFYEAFLSILEVYGFIAMETGDITKILPNASARQYPGYLNTDDAAADDIVTQVIQVQNIGAAQLVPILRPLIPQYGHLAAHPGSNMLIISDRAMNVKRMVRIIRRIDQSNDEDIEVVPLSHASATEVVRVLTALTQAPRSDGLPVTTTLVSDSRTNSVLIGGDKSERLRLRVLIAHLDTPLEDGGDTQVRYLRFADAEDLSAKLQQHFTQQAAAEGAAPSAASGAGVNVWADAQTNAIVVNAPPKMMRSLMSIVDKLDIRRAQVLVEAIIVEVLATKTSEIGVTWAVDGSGSNNPIAVTNFPGAGAGVVQLAGAIGSGDGGTTNPGSLIGDGLTFGLGRLSDSGISFAAILTALQGDADTNIISTPSLVTTDNEEASLNVGQEVPFLSGSFTSTGAAGAVNPFQTIRREQVGVKLVITPQINEGGSSLLLKISQEISSIAASVEGAADLVTNERIIETTVIVDDGEILVLGGLLEDVLRESNQRVPILGSIPILGALFRTQKVDSVKTNLMMFIRATILRDSIQTAFETGAKYNAIREVQREGSSFGLLRPEHRPMLPPLESYRPTAPENSATQPDSDE